MLPYEDFLSMLNEATDPVHLATINRRLVAASVASGFLREDFEVTDVWGEPLRSPRHGTIPCLYFDKGELHPSIPFETNVYVVGSGGLRSWELEFPALQFAVTFPYAVVNESVTGRDYVVTT